MVVAWGTQRRRFCEAVLKRKSQTNERKEEEDDEGGKGALCRICCSRDETEGEAAGYRSGKLQGTTPVDLWVDWTAGVSGWMMGERLLACQWLSEICYLVLSLSGD